MKLLTLVAASCALFGCPGDAPTPRGDQPVIPRDGQVPPPTFDGQTPPPDIAGPRDLTIDSAPPQPDAGGGCSGAEQGFGGKCYRVVSGFDMSYASAKQACAAQGGAAVVAIETSGEDLFVYNLLPPTSTAAWIGLVRQGGGFVWEASGAAPGYTNWASGEPNNSDGTEDCVVMWGPSLTFANLRAKWNDAPCSSTLRDTVVCER